MEKRCYPRVVKPFHAIVENGEGAHVRVVAVDASSEGLCVQCNIFERNLLTPGGSFVRGDGKPVELYVWLELPVGQREHEKIGARCHVAFSRRISSDQCKIGMRYMELDESEHEKLLRYVESSIASND